MSIFSLDIGNSKSAVAIVENGRVTDSLREKHESGNDENQLLALHAWCAERIGENSPLGMVVASVVPERSSRWKALWNASRASHALELQEVSAQTIFPFELAIEDPAGVGADRWCNLAGAMARGYRSALVVDLGTANTFDLLRDGRFEGGLIAPGLNSSLRALTQAGALLPEVEFARPRRLLGQDTVEAIQAGSWYQGVLGVGGLIDHIRSQHRGLPVLLTGGLSPSIARELDEIELVEPELTLEGAASLFRNSAV
ncbi:MAG TPA: type III pantothenate kinase [Candidatus Krumholzibacteria bacterium]|nr:type III pantothenate kinase [Candidatus Krumholzibacteria bacterium]